MSNRGAKLVVLGKLVVAAIAIVAPVALPARQPAPSMSLAQLLLSCAAGVVGILGLVIIGASCSLQFSQFILRVGGTDAQWFWFPDEPKGVAALRGGQSDSQGAGD